MNSRDKLLIRANMWAALMNVNDEIYFEGMFDEEPQITSFIIDAVADYIMSRSTEDFDTYIRDALIDEYGFIGSEEAKQIEEDHQKCVKYKIDKNNTTGLCDTCKHLGEEPDGPICGPCWCGIVDHFTAKESDI